GHVRARRQNRRRSRHRQYAPAGQPGSATPGRPPGLSPPTASPPALAVLETTHAHLSLMTITTPIRVLVADDHPLLREGIAAVLAAQADIELIGEAGDGIEALDCFRRLHPDVTLMDLQMPRMNGIEAIQAIRGE